MTTLEFDTYKKQFLHELTFLSTDENYLKIALLYVKGLADRKKKADASCMTKQEILKDFDEACKALKQYEAGNTKAHPIEELLNGM